MSRESVHSSCFVPKVFGLLFSMIFFLICLVGGAALLSSCRSSSDEERRARIERAAVDAFGSYNEGLTPEPLEFSFGPHSGSLVVDSRPVAISTYEDVEEFDEVYVYSTRSEDRVTVFAVSALNDDTGRYIVLSAPIAPSVFDEEPESYTRGFAEQVRDFLDRIKSD